MRISFHLQIKNVSLVIIFGIDTLLSDSSASLFLQNTSNYHNVINLIKVFMFLGIASMLYFIGSIRFCPYFMQFINFVQKYI